MKKRSFLLILALIVSISGTYILRYNVPFVYDALYENNKVTSIQQVDEILSEFETVSVQNLSNSYLKSSGIYSKKNRHLYRVGRYYLVPEKFLMKKILGNNRINSISSRGSIDNKRPLLLDRKVLYKFMQLYSILKKRGYDPDAMVVTSGHRHPNHNKDIGGAKKSRHVLGQAIDIKVGDIDRNGRVEFLDKNIVYKILDKEVIKNKGGIGRYPKSKTALHFDVRGHRARWDSF